MKISNIPDRTFDGRGPSDQLKHQYKTFRKTGTDFRRAPVNWIKFPISFVEYETSEMVAGFNGGAPRRRSVTQLRVEHVQTFYATLDDLAESLVPQTRMTRWGYYYRNRRLTHKFIAPFDQHNMGLLLDTTIPLVMRGDMLGVLLDKALETGLQYERDFVNLKTSLYTKIVSQDFRLFLVDQLELCPPFDLLFETISDLHAPFSFDLES